MKVSKLEKNLIKVCLKFNIGKLESYNKELSNQNNVYKVVTDKGIFIIKEFTKDAIGNYYYLTKRKKQLKIAKKLNDNGISCAIPKVINKGHFFLLNNRYYLVYEYDKASCIDEKDYTLTHIKVISQIQAKIHKLNLQAKLPCVYKKINIDIDELLRKGKKHPDFYNYLEENKDKLFNLINICNDNISKMKENLCISHNDYKMKNILWEKLKPTLIDFDASGMANPTCCMAESALNFSLNESSYDYDKYKVYLESYIAVYGKVKENYKEVLFCCMNGKLQWYNYLISKKNFDNIYGMTKDLIMYYDNIEKFYNIYKSIY